MSSSISVSDADSSPRADSSYVLVLLATIATCTIVTIAALQWSWSHYDLFQSISPFRYQLWLAERSEPPVTAIAVGDSHAGMGFYAPPGPVKSVAFAGESVRETRLKLEFVLPRLKDLKIVYLQAQPHMFFPHRDMIPKIFYQDLVQARSFNPLEHVLAQFDSCCRARVLPETLRALAGGPPTPPEPKIEPNGYLDYATPVLHVGDFKRLAANEVASYGELRFSKQLLEEYQAMIAMLKAKGVESVLVRYPLSKSYRAVLPGAMVQRADEFFSGLTEQYGLRRCGDWAAFEDEGLFFNADHLNRSGANLYWMMIEPCLSSAK